MKAIYAPDTNFLLQFREPSQVNWKDLTPADEVELVILLSVLRELDKHNHGPNGRRRRVAERVLKSIRGLEPGKDIEVRSQGPRVVFRELDPVEAAATIPGWIDTDKADEAILAEILEYQAAGITDLQLLTADEALKRLARRAGVVAVMPPDEWKLPPEPDANEKRVNELERQVRQLLGRAPEIRVWPEVEGIRAETIELRMQRFPPLSSEFVQHALAAVARKYPDATLARVGITVYRQDSLDAYKAKRHDWLAEIEQRLEGLHQRLNIQHGQVLVDLCVENAGAATANGFVLEVDAEGAFRLLDREDRALERFMEPVKFPEAPRLRTSFEEALSVPIWSSESFSRHEHGIPDFRVRATPDSPDFDWWYEELVVDRVRASCGKFRRDRRPERHTLALIVPLDLDEQEQVNGRLGGWYVADDLAEQTTFGFPVRIAMDWQDTEAEAARLLQDQLQVEL